MPDCQRSVLIVDRSEENREVLQTVLERHGVRTLAASEPEKAAELARQNRSTWSCSTWNRAGQSRYGHRGDPVPLLVEPDEHRLNGPSPK